MSSAETEPAAEDELPPGPFPSWGFLYGLVIVYTAALVALLYAFTVAFDHAGTP